MSGAEPNRQTAAESASAASTRRVAFLGPHATFTEAALVDLLTARGELVTTERVPVHSAELAIAAVEAGDVDAAAVPIENSVEGGVPATLDALTRHGSLQIIAESNLAIRMVLAARPGTQLSDISVFGTHPHAEAQVRTWMQANLGDVDFHPTSSTAAAAQELGAAAQESAADIPFQAVVCPQIAAETYGLTVLADNIGAGTAPVTRFVLVQRPGTLPEPTGADRTTIVVGLASDRAGALLELLEQFAARGVNLSRIESRPTGDGLGLYQFSIDIVGHIGEARVREALGGVHRVAAKVQFLGSFPAADTAPEPLSPRVADEAFSAAEEWLSTIFRAGAIGRSASV